MPISWDAVAAISSTIASISVTLTVVYLAVQVKRSTTATHSQTYQSATQALGEMAAIVGGSKEKAQLFTTGMATPEKLDEAEFNQFAYLGISLFRRYENVFFQYQSGMIDEDFWNGHRDNLLWFFHRPGTQRWWQDRRLGFSKRFRTFLESTSADEIIAPASRRV